MGIYFFGGHETTYVNARVSYRFHTFAEKWWFHTWFHTPSTQTGFILGFIPAFIGFVPSFVHKSAMPVRKAGDLHKTSAIFPRSKRLTREPATFCSSGARTE